MRASTRRGWFRKPRYRLLSSVFPRWTMRTKLRKTYHHPVADLVRGRFLDLGCGSGACAALRGFFHGGFNVGLDLSRPATALAEREARRMGIPARYLAGDAFRLPFRDAAFDTVYAGQMLEHLHGERRAVAEAARVLRPGGRLILSVPIGDQCGGAEVGHLNFYDTEDDCRKLLAELPFQVEGFLPFHKRRWFLSARRI